MDFLISLDFTLIKEKSIKDDMLFIELEKAKKENEKLKEQLEKMSLQNTKLKQICKFFAEENMEIQEKYNKLIHKQN